MKLRVREPRFFVDEIPMRIPFRFGMATLSRASLLTASVRVETDSGASADGFSADLLVPKWFDKDPKKSNEENVRELVASARLAAAEFTARDRPAAPLFEAWWDVYQRRVGRAPDPARALVDGFGVALIERAAIDALCRAAKCSFFAALRANLFGIQFGAVHDELNGLDVASILPAAPRRTLLVRHTVGLADAVRAREILPERRVDDGFPQALEEDVARYGLRCFKIKLGGNVGEDRERLLALAAFFAEPEVASRRGKDPLIFTVDGNEQYRDLGALASLLDDVAADSRGAAWLRTLEYIEQPLARSTTFDPAQRMNLARVSGRAPVILDEADFGVDAFPRAIELGYRGISVKNCKGVFRALLHRAWCVARGGGLFQSAEDLTNLPIVALQQDLATIAALDLPHAERNGHHYFRGLAHLPRSEVRAALVAHPDLYEMDEAGPRLKIRDGTLTIASVQCAGYGYDVPVDVAARRPLSSA